MILLLIISIIPTISLFRAGVYRSGDIRTHAIQLMSFYQNLQEGIILPRWSGVLCGTFGCPIFEFEYILAYYLSSILHFIGFSFVTSIKLVLALSFIVSGLTMYLWAKEELSRNAAFASAIFYLFAPYHLIDLHFRGDVGEIPAFVCIPLLFYFAKKIIEKHDTKAFFLEAITILLLVLTHAPTAIFSVPLVLVYGLVVWLRKKDRVVYDLALFVCSLVYGVLISAFYWMPAEFEAKYTWYSLTAMPVDFKPIFEYLYSPIAFGFLFQGHHGEYRLIIGYMQLIMIAIAIILLVKKKIAKKIMGLLLFFLLSFAVLFFMLQSISKPIWYSISILHAFLDIWKILTPIDFITAAIAGIVLTKLRNDSILILICYITIVSTVLNWANRVMVPINTNIQTAYDMYTEYLQQDNPIYLKRFDTRFTQIPKIVDAIPSSPIEFLQGNGGFKQVKRGQQEHEYVIHAATNSVIKENTYYFPGWTVYANNKTIPINYQYNSVNDFGKITFSLKKGFYLIDVRFMDTPIRSVAERISTLASCIGVIFYLFYNIKNKLIIKKRYS